MKTTVGFQQLLFWWNASKIVELSGLVCCWVFSLLFWSFFTLLKQRTVKDLTREENQNSGSSYIFLVDMATKTLSSVWVSGDTAFSYFISLPLYLGSPYLLLENFWAAQWLYSLTLMPYLSRIMVLYFVFKMQYDPS